MARQIVPVLFCLTLSVYFTAGYLVLDVDPATISPGLTSSLTVNCSFTYGTFTNVSTILSLILSKDNSADALGQHYTELASLNSFAADQISQQSLSNASVAGHVGTGDNSYLSIQWAYPSTTEKGLYRCDANVMDNTGHPFDISQTAQVTINSAGVDQLSDRLSLLETQFQIQQNLEADLEQQVAILKSLAQNQSQIIAALQSQNERQWKLLTDMLNPAFQVSAPYNGSYYLLSRNTWNESSVAEATCEKYTGYLAEIADASEGQHVKDFLETSTTVTHVLISGTDQAQEGQWMYTYSNTPLTFLDWSTGEPDTLEFHCMQMYRVNGWRTMDFPCNHSLVSRYFLCELPTY